VNDAYESGSGTQVQKAFSMRMMEGWGDWGQDVSSIGTLLQ